MNATKKVTVEFSMSEKQAQHLCLILNGIDKKEIPILIDEGLKIVDISDIQNSFEGSEDDVIDSVFETLVNTRTALRELVEDK